jgi:hypothetical protein
LPASTRVARVQHEVEDDLLDVVRVGHDCDRIVRHVDLERDVLANQSPEDVAQVRDGARQIDALEPRVMLVAEREELPCQTGSAIRGLADLLEILVVRVAARVLVEQQIRVSQRYRQKIVEVVRNAGDELSDGVHLLRVPELLFGSFEVERRLPLRGDRRPQLRFVRAQSAQCPLAAGDDVGAEDADPDEEHDARIPVEITAKRDRRQQRA